MSFGFGVGDFLAVSKLALDVYTAYKNAPADFKNISDEVKSLHAILDSDTLKAKFQGLNLNMAPQEQKRLQVILQGCRKVLEDLDKLLIAYNGLGSSPGSSSRALLRVRWGQEAVAELRARLTSNITLLNTFVTNCTQAEIQHAIGEIQSMLKNSKGLHRKSSISSLGSIASFEDSINNKEAWKQLCRGLYKAGVTADIIHERQDEIIELLQGSSPAIILQADTANSSSATLDGGNINDPSKDAKTGKEKRNKTFKINWAPLNALTGPLLIEAAKTGDVKAVRLRLTVVGDIEYQDIDKCTALCWAARNGHIETVKLLLDRGANIEAMIGDTEETALSFAARSGHMQVVRLLLEKGANMEGAYKHVKWSLVTGEIIVRAEEVACEQGSITVGANLEEFNYEKIIEFETLDTCTQALEAIYPQGNPKVSAQSMMKELQRNLISNRPWNGRIATGLAGALVRTMALTLNTLLPPAIMNSAHVPTGLRYTSTPAGTPGPCAHPQPQHPWPENIVGRLWHWPLIVQAEVDSTDGTGPKMEKQTVRISLIERKMGGWLVPPEAVEALLTLWLFNLKQRCVTSLPKGTQAPAKVPFVRLLGSNTDLTRQDIIQWCIDHCICTRVYEGKPITISEAINNEKQADQIDINIDGMLNLVVGIEQIDLRSEMDEWERGVHWQQTSIPHRAATRWRYFRGRELSQVLDQDWKRPDRWHTSLAATVECTIEEICVQEVLFRFFYAIGIFMREEKGIRVCGNTTVSYPSTNLRVATSSPDPESLSLRRLEAAKFHNSILERIALEAYQSKVCGSLEEAYQCIIPAFSQARVLPEVGEVIISQVTQTYRTLVGKGDWIKACDLYKWVWDSTGFKFPHHSNGDLHAIALFTNFVRKLSHEANTEYHVGAVTKKLAERGEAMLKTMTEQEFQSRDIVRALGFILQSLDELDSQMQGKIFESEFIEARGSGGHGTPESQGEDIPTGLGLEFELRRMKEELEKPFPLLGFTSTHKSMANILGASASINTDLDLERDADILDILQRRPLHYAASNTMLESSMLEFLIQKTSGVDQRDINGNTPLHLAASRNNVKFIEALKKLSLDRDPEIYKKAIVDFNATNELKWTPLHYAAWKGHEGMVDQLIKSGAIIDADDIINRSPLHWAAQGGHLDVVKVLIQKRANTKALDAYWRSPLHVAAYEGNGEVVVELVHHGARLEYADKEGKRPLDLAIELLQKKWAENEKVWQWPNLDLSEEKNAANQAADQATFAELGESLLDALLINEEGKAKGRTRLHCAAYKGEAQAVEMLLDLDAKKKAGLNLENGKKSKQIAIADQTDHAGETALHVAARGGHLDVVKILIQHECSLRIKNLCCENVLMVAVKHNQPAVVEVLLLAIKAEKVPDISQQAVDSPRARPSIDIVSRAASNDNIGIYPLHWAAWHGSLEIVRMLVQIGGVNPRKYDSVGMTAIHNAALMGHCHVVAWLLEQTPDLIEARDDAWNTPLHCAVLGGRVEVVRFLLDRFKFIDRRDNGFSGSHGRLKAFVNRANKYRETPLHCAAKGLIYASILKEQYLNKLTAMDCESLGQDIRKWQEEFVGLLSRKGSNHDAPSVSEECERKVLELLLDNTADIEARDKDDETPLHLAARWGRLTIAETLLKRLPLPPDQPFEKWEKANVCAEDIHKNTPLHLAARWGHQKIVKVLYHEQAPLGALNRYGHTPDQVAEDHHQFDISALLKCLLSGPIDSASIASDSEEGTGGMRNA